MDHEISVNQETSFVTHGYHGWIYIKHRRNQFRIKTRVIILCIAQCIGIQRVIS